MLDLNNSIKPQSVYVWGISEYFKNYYLDYLKESGIKLEYIIDSYRHGSKISEFDVYSPLQFKKNLKNTNSTIYIVITAISDDYEIYFKQILTEFLSLNISNNIKFLHPVFLAQYLSIDLDHAPFVYSISGSGSIFTKSIIQELTTYKQSNNINNFKLLFFSRLAKHHFEMLSNTLIHISSNKSINNFWVGRGYNSSLFNISFDKKYIALYLKSFHYFSEKVPSFHTILNQNIITNKKNMNYNSIGIYRNPLDVLVSNAFKIHKPIIDSLDINEKKEFKAIFGCSRMENLEWFYNYALIVKKYYEKMYQYKDQILIVKYENLLKTNSKDIKKIANYLKIDINDNQTERIWKKFAFKPLQVKDQSHYNKPSEGKWKKYFDNRHIEILKKLDFDTLLEKMDYQKTLKEFLTFGNKEVINYDNIEDNVKSVAYLHDFHYKLLFDQKITNWGSEKIYYDKNQNLEYATNSKEYYKIIKKIEDNQYFTNILFSASV